MKTEIRIQDELNEESYRAIPKAIAKIGCLFIAIVLLIVTVILLTSW